MELRQDRMNHEERLNALLNYQKPDRVPIFGTGSGFYMINCGYTLTEVETDPYKFWDALRFTSEQYGWEPLWQPIAGTVMTSWDFGGRMKMPDSPYAMSASVEDFPVKTEDDVLNLKMPDPKTAGAIPKRMEFSKIQENAGWPVTFVSRSPYGAAVNTCGAEQFSKWLMKKPQLCERLIRTVLEHILNVLQYWVDTFGADKIVYLTSSSNESNQLFSPKHIQEYALPYHRELHQQMRVMGIDKFRFHICGEQNLNLPFLAKLASSADGWPHPCMLHFGHEVDLEDAAKYFPDDIIMGNVEPVIFQTGSPEQVYEQCCKCIEKGKKISGGFILATGCMLPPKAPPYNVWMMTKAVNDFGWYE